MESLFSFRGLIATLLLGAVAGGAPTTQRVAATQPTTRPTGPFEDPVAALASQRAMARAFIGGVMSGKIPAWPKDVRYSSDDPYYVSSSAGADGNPGTPALPFKTLAKAESAVNFDLGRPRPPALPSIHLLAKDTFNVAGNGVPRTVLIDGSWKAAGAEQRATIVSTDTGFISVGSVADHMHLQNLRVLADPVKGGNYGVYVNGGDDITLDYCEVSGFAMNVDIIGAATHVRLYHNWIANAWSSSVSTESCSGLYTEIGAGGDVECNIFYHNGWRAPFDLTNAALVQGMMFHHGWYENPGNGHAIAAIDKFNFYMRNGATGHQCRAGGSAVLWDVFWDNGNAADVFTGPGFYNNLGGEIGNCAIFGSLTNDMASWGGGVAGQSVADNFHDLLFSGASTMQLPAAIMFNWGGGGNVLAPVPNPPATATAKATNCRGIWPNAPVTLLNGRTATLVNINIRKPLPGEKPPSLLDYFATTGDDSTADFLRTHLHDPLCSAQAVIAWLRANLPN